MIQASSRRLQERLPPTRSEFEVKGLVVIGICYFYGLLLFLLFGGAATFSMYMKSKLTERLKRFQFWDIEKKSKYDINHNIRSTRHTHIGER